MKERVGRLFRCSEPRRQIGCLLEGLIGGAERKNGWQLAEYAGDPAALFRLQSPPWDHWLLIRRSIADPTGMAFYVTFWPHVTELNELAAVAGLRWTIEECFQSAKGETGRRVLGMLSMLARV